MTTIFTVLFGLWLVGAVLVGGLGFLSVHMRGGFEAVSEDYRLITGSTASTTAYEWLFLVGILAWPYTIYSIVKWSKQLRGQ